MYQEKGNIVAEYNINGVRVLVSDSAYAGKSQTELDEIRRDAQRISWNIVLRHEARKRKECITNENQQTPNAG